MARELDRRAADTGMIKKKKYLYFTENGKEHVSVAVVRARTKKEARRILLIYFKRVDRRDIYLIKGSQRNGPLNRIRILSMY